MNQVLPALVAQASPVFPVHQGLKEILVFRVLQEVLDFLVRKVSRDSLGRLVRLAL